MGAAPTEAPTPDALPEPLRALAIRGVPHRFRKGTVLITEGDHGDSLYIVLSGRVRAFSTDEQDNEIIYAEYGAGALFGEMSLDGGPRSASVITLEPTVCVTITRHTLREHIAANPDFAFDLLARVIHRARMATQSARGMALLDMYGRIVQVLDLLAMPAADGTRVITTPPTHKEIAKRIGGDRSTVTLKLGALVEGGYLRIEKGQWVLTRALPTRW